MSWTLRVLTNIITFICPLVKFTRPSYHRIANCSKYHQFLQQRGLASEFCIWGALVSFAEASVSNIGCMPHSICPGSKKSMDQVTFESWSGFLRPLMAAQMSIKAAALAAAVYHWIIMAAAIAAAFTIYQTWPQRWFYMAHFIYHNVLLNWCTAYFQNDKIFSSWRIAFIILFCSIDVRHIFGTINSVLLSALLLSYCFALLMQEIFLGAPGACQLKT